MASNSITLSTKDEYLLAGGLLLGVGLLIYLLLCKSMYNKLQKLKKEYTIKFNWIFRGMWIAFFMIIAGLVIITYMLSSSSSTALLPTSMATSMASA